MKGERVERRLAAILAADVAGYSRLMGEDEEGTLARLKVHHNELIDPGIAEHHGRIVKTTGDGMLVEFGSVVDAVRCAVAVQQAMAERNAVDPPDRCIEFRVGINLGDVIFDGDDLFGDGVNIAARLEGLAEPGGICISDDAFRQVRGKIEAEFADIGEQTLKNIARPLRVYRVRVALTHPDANVRGSTLSRNAGEGAERRGREAGEGSQPLPLPDKPSIAVLPFQNMTGDPEQEYFADGMVEEIITALSRIRWLFVIARNSSFTYKGRAVDVKQVGRELGVRYVLEGSVRKSGTRVRITAQLIEAASDPHLWADRFDGSLEDVFDLQDQVATSVAGVIEPTLQVAEMRRAADRPTSDLTAYDLYLRAVGNFWPPSRERVTENLRLLEQAIERDPKYGPALAWAAICHVRAHQDGWALDPDLAQERGLDLARRALDPAGAEPVVIVNAAYALAYFGEDIRAMLAMIDRAMNLNPSFARGWYLSGMLRLMAGDLDTAIDHIERSQRLSPRDPVGTQSLLIGVGHFFAHRLATAVVKLELAVQERPTVAFGYRFLAACYAHLGRLDEAHQVIDRLRRLAPIVVEDTSWRRAEDRELLMSGLRLAMGEVS